MTRFNLPEIDFTNKSVEQIQQEVIDRYEADSGRTLSDGDPTRILLLSIVALLAQQRAAIDFTGKQNLIGYAIDDYLDHIGASSDTPRLSETAATTTIRFNLSISTTQIIRAGTRGTAGDGIFFATLEDATVPSGQMYVDVQAQCTVAGSIGNGYAPGRINQLVDPIQWVASIENTTTSEGGSDTESDDAYAERIQAAPESFSVAGPEGAYKYWARSASPLIVDVSVRSPSDGVVEIRPLLQNGELPGQEILDLVLETCSDRKVRPLTDHVQVLAPEQVLYDLNVSYWISTENSAVAASIQSSIQKAVEDYKLWQRSRQGRDIDPSELSTRMKNAGAKRVAVTLPAHQAIESYQIAKENNVTVTYGGLEND